MKLTIKKSDIFYWGIAGIYSWNLLEHNIYNGLNLKFINYFSSSLSTFLIIVILAILIINQGERNLNIFLFIGFILISIALSYINVDARKYISGIFGGASQIKLYFIVPLSFLCIKKPDTFLEKLSILSILVGLIHIYTFINQGYLNEWNQTDYMFFGMEMLIPISVIMLRAFQTHKKLYFIIAIVYSLYTVVFAHRGAILVIIILLITYLYLFSTKIRKIQMCFFILVGGILLYLFFSEILQMIIEFMNIFNIESRTLELLLEGKIGDSSGRDKIWSVCIESIRNNIFVGTGIGSDRVLLHNTVGNFYAHNFILELMVAFGFVIGSLLVMLIIWMGIHAIRMKNNLDWRDLFLPFYIISVTTLMTSNSIFTFQPMWICIVVFCMLRQKEKTKENA